MLVWRTHRDAQKVIDAWLIEMPYHHCPLTQRLR
jgi:L-arabinose isomerase